MSNIYKHIQPFSMSYYDMLKSVPIVGHALKAVEILTELLSELRATMTTLEAAEKKAEKGGSVSKASLHTIAGVCSAIGALVAAIADPEPFTKCGLIATGVGAIAYTSLISSMPSEEKIKLQAEP